MVPNTCSGVIPKSCTFLFIGTPSSSNMLCTFAHGKWSQEWTDNDQFISEGRLHKTNSFHGQCIGNWSLIWCDFSWYGLGLTKAPFTHQEMRAIMTMLEQTEEQVIISMFHGHMANSEMLITWQCGSMCSCLLPTNITLTWSWSLRVLILVSVGLHTWNTLTLTNLHHNN